jgi:hypothetical protein
MKAFDLAVRLRMVGRRENVDTAIPRDQLDELLALEHKPIVGLAMNKTNMKDKKKERPTTSPSAPLRG